MHNRLVNFISFIHAALVSKTPNQYVWETDMFQNNIFWIVYVLRI